MHIVTNPAHCDCHGHTLTLTLTLALTLTLTTLFPQAPGLFFYHHIAKPPVGKGL